MVMVRKLGTVAMVLTLVMMLGGAAAAQLGGTTDQTVEVTANVGPYAELRCDVSLALPDFTGFAYEQQQENGSCTMASNTAVNLGLEFAPLTHGSPANATEIGTAVMLDGGLPTGDPLRLIAGPWSKDSGDAPTGHSDYSDWKFVNEASWKNIQFRGVTDYSLQVWGKLGEIQDQAAGQYKTEIVLTVSVN